MRTPRARSTAASTTRAWATPPQISRWVGGGAHAPGAGEVGGQRAAQLGVAAGIAVAEGLVGGGRDGAAGGSEPLDARKAGEVRAAGAQVVEGPGGLPGAPGRGFGRRGGDPVGDAGARALARGEPALGDEVGVGVGDGVAGDTEVGGEDAGRGEPGTGSQPAGADGLAQRVGETAAQAGTGGFEVQVHAESGPGIRHGNGPYRWAVSCLGSKA
ncbi:hypothetical protein SLI_5109 [Streptomyces lividans 1326]|uniref:Uncharacterized protein n=1 Tax=Streptomyces lividans 1326 TaxID=1200984 RepID=A0A7U9DV89_STRLI|nr:hypothetical protein SLI_5109 [Streptomyces lividans 1326]